MKTRFKWWKVYEWKHTQKSVYYAPNEVEWSEWIINFVGREFCLFSDWLPFETKQCLSFHFINNFHTQRKYSLRREREREKKSIGIIGGLMNIKSSQPRVCANGKTWNNKKSADAIERNTEKKNYIQRLFSGRKVRMAMMLCELVVTNAYECFLWATYL